MCYLVNSCYDFDDCDKYLKAGSCHVEFLSYLGINNNATLTDFDYVDNIDRLSSVKSNIFVCIKTSRGIKEHTKKKMPNWPLLLVDVN